MIPQRRPEQSFDAHQAEVAAWCGYEGDDAVAQLNRDHDPLHREMCFMFGAGSLSLAHGRGEHLTEEQREVAEMEEVAVLATQRWLTHYRRLM